MGFYGVWILYEGISLARKGHLFYALREYRKGKNLGKA
jgi:hypothetical protein